MVSPAGHNMRVCMRRAARFANSAARGGQIMVPLALARKLVTEWTGADLSLAEDNAPTLLECPDYVPQPTGNPLPQPGLLPDEGAVEVEEPLMQQAAIPRSRLSRHSTVIAAAAGRLLKKAVSRSPRVSRASAMNDMDSAGEQMLAAAIEALLA